MENSEIERFLSTWGPHCGAPKAVFEGHLRKMILEIERPLVKRVRELEDTVRQARTAFMENGSRALVALKMIKILDAEKLEEERL